MIKEDALAMLDASEGELIFAELDLDDAKANLKSAELQLEVAQRRLKAATRDAILNRQVAETFERGGRHADGIEDFRQNLRDYVTARGPVEHMKIVGIKESTWDQLSNQSKQTAMTNIRAEEEKKEQEILSGFRDRFGNLFPQYAHLQHEEVDIEAQAILASQEESRLRTETYENTVRVEAELQAAEAEPEIEYRITLMGRRVPVTRK